MNIIRRLARPRENLQSCIRRYYGADPTKSKCSDKASSKEKKEKKGDEGKDKQPYPFYDARKYSHNLPGGDVCVPFEPLPKIPTGVFRVTCNEVLGPIAGKCAYYRNPEYYSFHHMSFFDLSSSLVPYRLPQIKTGRKPIIM